MINIINEIFNFNFAIDSYMPLLGRMVLIAIGLVLITIVCVILNYTGIKIIDKIFYYIGIVAACAFVIEISLLFIIICILPVYLCSIALKLFLMTFIPIPEIILVIIAILITTIVFYILSKIIDY